MLILPVADSAVTSAVPSSKEAVARFEIPGQLATVETAEAWKVLVVPFARLPNEHVSLPPGPRLQALASAPPSDQASPVGRVSVSETLNTGPPLAVALIE